QRRVVHGTREMRREQLVVGRPRLDASPSGARGLEGSRERVVDEALAGAVGQLAAGGEAVVRHGIDLALRGVTEVHPAERVRYARAMTLRFFIAAFVVGAVLIAHSVTSACSRVWTTGIERGMLGHAASSGQPAPTMVPRNVA